MVKKGLMIAIMVSVMFSWGTFIYAESPIDEPMEKYLDNPISKLGRGLGNFAFACFEIFVQADKEWKKHKNVVAIPTGVAKGLLYFGQRTVVGAYEVLTFPIPYPNNYGPIITPEFILEDLKSNRP
ncbi:exosortase system-associated protein, TIGR04073 family [Candidatus Omnitrophota bacterium]